jgi:hypothetical protein
LFERILITIGFEADWMCKYIYAHTSVRIMKIMSDVSTAYLQPIQVLYVFVTALMMVFKIQLV